MLLIEDDDPIRCPTPCISLMLETEFTTIEAYPFIPDSISLLMFRYLPSTREVCRTVVTEADVHCPNER